VLQAHASGPYPTRHTCRSAPLAQRMSPLSVGMEDSTEPISRSLRTAVPRQAPAARRHQPLPHAVTAPESDPPMPDSGLGTTPAPPPDCRVRRATSPLDRQRAAGASPPRLTLPESLQPTDEPRESPSHHRHTRPATPRTVPSA